MNMGMKYWVHLIVILAVGYFIGVSWPTWGQTAIAKVKGAL